MDDKGINRAGDLSSDDCERLHDLLPAYSIGATDAEETRLVESLLVSCPEAAGELDDYESLMGALLFVAPSVEPPSALHDRLIRAATGSSAPSLAPIPTQTARIIPFQRALIGFAVAAAALLVISNAYWIVRFNQLDGERRQMLDLLRGQGAVLAAVSSGSSHRIELASTANTSVGLATVLWSPQNDVALLYSSKLPPLQPGRTYQLWLIRGQTPVSGGLFQLDAQGEATYLFHPTQPLDHVDALGISDEPSGGSQAPSTTPIAVGAVQT